jgi:hypothetical protein
MKTEKAPSKWSLLHVCPAIAMFLLAATTTRAQQTTAPCMPSATTTIDGKDVPAPPPAFGGVINLGAEQS